MINSQQPCSRRKVFQYKQDLICKVIANIIINVEKRGFSFKISEKRQVHLLSSLPFEIIVLQLDIKRK